MNNMFVIVSDNRVLEIFNKYVIARNEATPNLQSRSVQFAIASFLAMTYVWV